MEHKEHFHGSDLEKIEKIYGIAKEEIIGFGANVNPLGISPKLREQFAAHLDVITTYPDREYTKLRKAISNYCNSPMDYILVGNGSTELISAVISYLSPKNALLLSPTYSEYEREISLSGGLVHYFQLLWKNDFALPMEELFSALLGMELFVICNPNNPTSSVLSVSQLRAILTFCKEHGIFVMIDETYVEFASDMENITALSLLSEFDNFIVLRGISKFFAAPGLRLGYGVSKNRSLLTHINETKNPWTISSLTDAAGQILFTDTDYIQKTKEYIYSERTRVCAALKKMDGLKVYEPKANFVLVQILKEELDADILFDLCIRRKMMIRNCATFKGLDHSFFRFCFMKQADNERLLQVIYDTLI